MSIFEDYDFILQDRIAKIKSILKIENQSKCYLSFSGGKDSTILHYLLDIALPNNTIPRIYCDTGIEFDEIRNFVLDLQRTDKRIQIIKPNKSVFQIEKEYGYPFKSKFHAHCVELFQKDNNSKSANIYANIGYGYTKKCPEILKYQFTKNCNLKIANQCCYYMKKLSFKQYEEKTNRTIAILGIKYQEGGVRSIAYKGCILNDKHGNLHKFMPLFPVTDDFEKWFCENYKINLCKLYYEPYNFQRTGCIGCPFNINLQHELDTLYSLSIIDYKKAIAIWKPVYDEYIKLGYRLKYYPHLKGVQEKMAELPLFKENI